MADVDTRATGSETPSPRSAAAELGETPRVGAGSVVFVMSMLVWASGQLVYDDSVVGAWALFLIGGICAPIGLQLAVGDEPGRSTARRLSRSLMAMLVLLGVSSTLDGAARMITVTAGVTLLVVAFVQAMAQLRRAQQRLAELAVIEERQRVAADVHDIVGHALAVTMLHVNAARMSLPDRPDAAIEALEEAERNGRSSMNEIRGVVRLLRSDDGTSLQSLPDLDDLPSLVQRITSTGQQVDLVDEIDPDRLSKLVSVTLYRLVQEALTNAVRYGAGPIAVTLTTSDGDATLEVVNEIGEGRHQVGGNVGLAAAQARVNSIGGTFDAGPVDANRWRLGARIPT